MDKINDGGPAFPGQTASGRFPGMTLRDWFAGQALIAVAQEWKSESVAAEVAYEIADAMLVERFKKDAAR